MSDPRPELHGAVSHDPGALGRWLLERGALDMGHPESADLLRAQGGLEARTDAA